MELTHIEEVCEGKRRANASGSGPLGWEGRHWEPFAMTVVGGGMAPPVNKIIMIMTILR